MVRFIHVFSPNLVVLLYNTGMDPSSNLILIGMPGSGKSTVGRILAGLLGWAFVDTDKLIEERRQKPLQTILDQEGIGAFIRVEAQVVRALNLSHHIIATGGSVVLDQIAMQHLRALGFVVYLDVPLPKIERRLWNIKTRGIVIKKHQSIRDIYRIRRPLYERYADKIQPTAGLSAQQIATAIKDWLLLQNESFSAGRSQTRV
ncbi:MAG: shikimate kinase [Clostridia bacterium]|nr:shikimate kinase [Clostridia bacterium]